MFSLRNLSISKRLTLGFGAIGTALLVTAAVALQGIGVLNQEIEAVKAESRRTIVTREFVNSIADLHLTMFHVVTATNASDRQAHLDAFGALGSRYQQQVATLQAGANADDLRFLDGIMTVVGSGKTVNDQVIALANAGHGAEATERFREKEGAIKAAIDKGTEAFLDHRAAQAAKVEAQLNAPLTWVRWSIALATLAGLALAGWIGWLITRNYVADIAGLAAYTKCMAKGDFSVAIPQESLNRKDEFGGLARDYQAMVENLRRLITGLSGGVYLVASSATELSASAEEMAATTSTLAQATDTQREHAEAMAATIEELSASIQAVSHGAQDAIAVMEEALAATREGDAAGKATQTAMEGVIRSGNQITSATMVISELAKQTNLLSLNAAIEAAKAGEKGRGFAVVAEEVRKLAERSASSAREITSLIQVAQKATEDGGATVAATVQLLSMIRESLARFADRTRQISAATAEQSQASQEVAQRVGHTVQGATASATATYQMAATTHEIARTAADLAKVAEHLRVQVEAFTL